MTMGHEDVKEKREVITPPGIFPGAHLFYRGILALLETSYTIIERTTNSSL